MVLAYTTRCASVVGSASGSNAPAGKLGEASAAHVENPCLFRGEKCLRDALGGGVSARVERRGGERVAPRAARGGRGCAHRVRRCDARGERMAGDSSNGMFGLTISPSKRRTGRAPRTSLSDASRFCRFERATFAQTSGRAPRRSRDGEESREARHLVPGARVGGVRAREVATIRERDTGDERRSPPRRCPPFRVAHRAPPAPRRGPRGREAHRGGGRR
jgi:hypothetical protein